MGYIKNRFLLIIVLFIFLTTACGISSLTNAQDTPTITGQQVVTAPTGIPAQATASPQSNLPPVLVEANPEPGSDLQLSGTFQFTFDQPMVCPPSENAILFVPPIDGRFECSTDLKTIGFTPSQPLIPDQNISITLQMNLEGTNGKNLAQPFELSYMTPANLQALEKVPAPGNGQIDPSSAVIVTFNNPVVPFSAEQAPAEPAAFTLSPAANGTGEWINTSTYVFYPDPPLFGGVEYTLNLNPALTSTAGAPLVFDETNSQSWSFTTAAPQLITVEPSSDHPIDLDAEFILHFNQPMDTVSVESNFTFRTDSGIDIPGTFSWNSDTSQLTFQANDILPRNTIFHLLLAGEALAKGGAALGENKVSDFMTVPDMAIKDTQPSLNEPLQIYSGYSSFQINFTAPLANQNFQSLITLTPPIGDMYLYESDPSSVIVSGFFAPATNYTLTIQSSLQDRWNQQLKQAAIIQFTTSNAYPSLSIPLILYADPVLFVTPADTSLNVQATNIETLQTAFVQLTLFEFHEKLIYGSSYSPPVTDTWSQTLSLPSNQNKTVSVPLSPDGNPLQPGIYYYDMTSPQLSTEGSQPLTPFMTIVSRINLVVKRSQNQVMVWAMNLESGSPLGGANIDIYNDEFSLVANGTTGEDGIVLIDLPAGVSPYDRIFAVTGEPGDANFSLAMTTWSYGVTSWDFGLYTTSVENDLVSYTYTDRPIYRPGQTVYYRSVLRQADNARYSLPDLGQVRVEILSAPDPQTGQTPVLDTQDLTLSPYGSISGSFVLPNDAPPGFYSINLPDVPNSFFNFTVAEYRKPEIDVQVAFAKTDYQSGEDINASISANYFFGAPAGNVPLHWALYTKLDNFYLPYAYQVGIQDFSWMTEIGYPISNPLGSLVIEGDNETNPNGTFSLNLPFSDLESNLNLEQISELTLEVTLQDISSQPVSARQSLTLHPSSFYVGLRPDAWSVSAGTQVSFAVQTVDWQQHNSPAHSLSALFEEVTWTNEQLADGTTQSTPVYLPVSSASFTTDQNGQSLLAFTPLEPGTYRLSVQGEGAVTRILIWVGGSGSASWPSLPDQHIPLTTDAASYDVGQTAKILIPNPFNQSVTALVTIERGKVMEAYTVSMSGSSHELALPILEDYAPNIYVSIILLGTRADGSPDFRQGFLQLNVAPTAEELQVHLVAAPERLEPGQDVQLTLQVTDALGNPVQGEFSLGLVDKAIYALADANAPSILDAFYGIQPLGVINSLSLAAYSNRNVPFAGATGIGGGGGNQGEITRIRQQFLDTAYWNANITTDANGMAQVTVTMPDNLTTWVATLRGLTVDTRVGETQSEVLTTKDLLIRPQTPRFLVAGDHLQLSAVVNNNTSQPLDTEISLQAAGFTLDDETTALQTVQVPANGSTFVTWWGKVEEIDQVEAIFNAQSGPLSDVTTPTSGNIPVLHYSSPQSFGTTGVLSEEGNTLEVVSLPQSFTPTGGSLRLEMTSSLAGTILDGLKALQTFPTDYTESILSRLLGNVTIYQMIKDQGLDSPSLETDLSSAIVEDVGRLKRSQNLDGGWSWLSGQESEPYISSYVLFGLVQASDAGFFVEDATKTNAQTYLTNSLVSPETASLPWQLDRLVFQHFSMVYSGIKNANTSILNDYSNQLSIWAKALLALTLDLQTPGNEISQNLISEIKGEVSSNSTGSHWQDQASSPMNMVTPNFTTAIVCYTLTHFDPQSPMLTEAVRYLVYNRRASGGWASSYESAWILLAMSESLKVTHELQADFDFDATLNEVPFANGTAAQNGLSSVAAEEPLGGLLSSSPNALLIQHGAGDGNLYYRAYLQVFKPVETVDPLQRGFAITRRYELSGTDCVGGNCNSVNAVQLVQLQTPLKVHLSVTVPEDTYYLAIEDFIPAGSEIVNTILNTTQLGSSSSTDAQDGQDPFANGWNWSVFGTPTIYDDHISWVASFVPAGTYELTYRILPTQVGEFRVLPAHVYEIYYPDVEGNSGGRIFTIRR